MDNRRKREGESPVACVDESRLPCKRGLGEGYHSPVIDLFMNVTFSMSLSSIGGCRYQEEGQDRLH